MAALGLAVLLLSAAAPVFAQKKPKEDLTVRTVEGTVTDASGKAIGGAVVHLKNTKTLQIRSFITKDDGGYAFHGLSTNIDYELKAEAQGGASSDVKTLSNFDSRRNAVINLKLKK
jgi:hypothetical protein